MHRGGPYDAPWLATSARRADTNHVAPRILAVALSLWACGSEPVSDPPTFDQDDDCLNCGGQVEDNATPPTGNAVRTLLAKPSALDFYFQASEHGMPHLAAKQFVIENQTDFDAAILAITLVDEPSAPGGADYFTATLVSTETLRAGTGQVTLEAAFSGSTRRRVARILVQTDHPNVSQIIVPVSGKVFVDAAW